ncbi:sensor histidine kinase [Sphingomonas sp. GCM10030256]|uniref:sensor histidine kinase n=1 Tax=Sphingomonas sp. GCM10030256 TaxID=3273427 RepID=UPI0036151DC4
MNYSWGVLHAGLQSVLDTALDAVIVMAEDGTIHGWNSVAEKVFGWSEAEVVGRQLSDVIIPDQHRAAHEGGRVHFLRTGEGPVLNRRIEVSALRRSDEEFPAELSVTCTEQFGSRLFVGFLRDISERVALAERQQRALQESDHRVKNMLTVVSAIAQQTARSAPDLTTFQEKFNGRLQSLARAHQLLVGKASSEVALTALVEQVLAEDVAGGRARFSGPELLLKPGQVLGLSMILHELYTNAVKYGALCGDEGSLVLDWSLDGGTVVMNWAEAGPPCEADVPSSGFGHRMIAMSVKSDLCGTVERDFSRDGLRVTLRFPIGG